VGWADPSPNEERPLAARRRRAVAVVLGLVVSFAIITAVGSAVLQFPRAASESDFADVGTSAALRVRRRPAASPISSDCSKNHSPFVSRAVVRGATASAFIFGLGLGTVFVPCAGPVLTAVTFLAPDTTPRSTACLLSFFFAAGAAVAAARHRPRRDRLIERNRGLSKRARRLRPLGGLLLILMAGALALNLHNGIQKFLPGYTTAFTTSRGRQTRSRLRN